jgi:hypothetical protein
MTLSVSTIVIVILCAVCAWLAAKWLFKKDTEMENRRRAAAQMAATLQGLGLKKIPQFLIDYSVGDYSGMAHKIGETARTFLEGEEEVLKEFEQVFGNLLAAKLKREEGRLFIEAKLKEAKALYEEPTPVAPAAEPKA